MNYHQNHRYFEMSTSGNVLTEILREVDKAREVLLSGNAVAATIHLEYVETIIDDACHQYGANSVFGCLEVSKLAKA